MALNKYIDLKPVKTYVVHNLIHNKEKYKSKDLLFNYSNIKKILSDECDPTYIINIYIEVCSLNQDNKYYKNCDKYSILLNIFIGLYYCYPNTIISLIEELPNYFFLVNLLSYIIKIKLVYESIFISKLNRLTNKILDIFVYQIDKDSSDLLITKKNKLPFPTISPLILYLTLTVSEAFLDKFIVKLFKRKISLSKILFDNLKNKLFECVSYLIDHNSNYALIYDHFDIYTINSVCLKRFYRNFFKESRKIIS